MHGYLIFHAFQAHFQHEFIIFIQYNRFFSRKDEGGILQSYLITDFFYAHLRETLPGSDNKQSVN